MLYIPDVNKPFVLDTDASTTALGAVLQQKDKDNHLKVVAYPVKS